MQEFEVDGGKIMFWNELDMVKMKKHEFCEELPDSADDNDIESYQKRFIKLAI